MYIPVVPTITRKEQQKENRQKWIKALRSGKYNRAEGVLKNDNGFCCLGVACEISGLGDWDIDILNYGEVYVYGKERSAVDLPNNVMRWLGLRTPSGGYGSKFDSLITNNDDEQKTFKDIADIIEEEPKGLIEQN